MQLPRPLLWFILLLLPFAFFVNLGVHPFIDDEGNRSLVALEMLWQNSFVTPTLHGDYYYNKPPLWNWLIALSFSLWGSASEWSARFPAVLSLLGFGYTIYYFVQKEWGRVKGVLVALFFLTCGRILFWESLLALIDISFSWAMFTLFMVVYQEGQKKSWRRLFLFSYLLMVVGFMFKGLPAIVFQGLTLVAYLVSIKEWKRLFSITHIASGLLSVSLLAVYYWAYHQENSLENVFQALFVESSKRTAVAYSVGDTLEHVVGFPLELFYHFLPWTFLPLLLFNKTYRLAALKHPFVRYCLLIFVVNISVYWLSPNFYPRYILMLVPLGFIVLVALIPDQWSIDDKLYLGVRWLLGLFVLVMLGAAVVTYFIEDTQSLSYLSLRSGVAVLGLLGLVWLYWKMPQAQFFIVVAGLLFFRLGFNFLALPPRAIDSRSERIKTATLAFAERWQGRDLAVFNDTHMEPAASFYLENDLHYIVPRQRNNFTLDRDYIYNPEQYSNELFMTPIDSFLVRHRKVTHYYVARLKRTDSLFIEAQTIGENPGF
ncbi:MAG: hypothetical protein AAGJ93_09815 [Bacteroidota bacterium]